MRRIHKLLTMSGGGAAVPRWLTGGVPAASCLRAYEPKGAASLAASYINLASPGTGDATAPTAPPTWDALNGWKFNAAGAQYLDTGLVPETGMAAIVKFTNIGNQDSYLIGSKTAVGQSFVLIPWLSGTNSVRYGNGGEGQRVPYLTEGVLGMAGAKGYRNGLDDGVNLTAWSGTATHTIHIGRLNRALPSGYLTGYIQALYIYKPAPTPAQMAAIMGALADPFFSLVAPVGAGEFMIAHIPDTHYGSAEAANAHNQITSFIAQYADDLGIEFVLHGGDLIYPPLDTDNTEWSAADSMIDNLDSANIPYLVTTGNHDYDADDSTNIVGRETTKFNTILPQSRYTSKTWWSGGFYEAGKTENAYCIKSIGGENWLFLALEFGPRQGVIDWANGLLTTHADKKVIVITHSYLHRDGTTVSTGDEYNPHSWTLDGDIHDGEEIWQELIKLHDNVVLVLSAHDKGFGASLMASASLVSVTDGGAKCVQMVGNYHAWSYANGMIRFLRINPTAKTIQVQTGSPYFNMMWRGAANEYTISWS